MISRIFHSGALSMIHEGMRRLTRKAIDRAYAVSSAAGLCEKAPGLRRAETDGVYDRETRRCAAVGDGVPPVRPPDIEKRHQRKGLMPVPTLPVRK